MKKAKILAVRRAGRDHAVVRVKGGVGYQKSPCEECPWRVSQTGNFPPEAFKISANTSHDMATETFACHMVGKDQPRTCAGFILKAGDDNLTVRIKKWEGKMLDVTANGAELHPSYATMAVANGVDKNDPALASCMPESRSKFYRRRKTRSVKQVCRE